MRVEVIQSECLKAMRSIPDGSIDACVTDPPYELGFMGKKWDATGIAYSVELWREVLRVLKPGAHLLAFGGTRTYHRMACAIEDAGFEVRDQIQWIYGQGFPKSKNVGNGRGTALKPANEPICLARKTLSEDTVAANVIEYGTGALNIDAARIPSEPIHRTRTTALGRMNDDGWQPKPQTYSNHPGGRWPANVILDEHAGMLLDEQSGERGNNYRANRANHKDSDSRKVFGSKLAIGASTYDDSGGASRFFYCAKPSRSERNAGCEDIEARRGRTCYDPQYHEGGGKLPPRSGNNHPTVKPVKLMRYLVRLVTPPDGTVLDIFTGSGTTGIAAVQEGFNFIGIEREADYCEIARRRIEATRNMKRALRAS